MRMLPNIVVNLQVDVALESAIRNIWQYLFVFVIIGNGSQYQLPVSYKHSCISIGVELKDDPIEIAGMGTKHLTLPV